MYQYGQHTYTSTIRMFTMKFYINILRKTKLTKMDNRS
jgi:hypothetical protein